MSGTIVLERVKERPLLYFRHQDVSLEEANL